MQTAEGGYPVIVQQQPQPVVMQPMQPMTMVGTEGMPTGSMGGQQQVVVVQQHVVAQDNSHLCCGDTGNEAVDHLLKNRPWCSGCGGGCCDLKMELVTWGSLMIFYGLLSCMFAYGDTLAIVVGLFSLVTGILYVITGAKHIKIIAMICIPLCPLLAIYNIYEAIYYMQWFSYAAVIILYHLVVAGTYCYITVATYHFWKAVQQI